jgi:NAD(P)-dependent dehydrogenase (short-subunit alcohol dehydrogenase family)
MTSRLDGKVALVTGGTSGIGEATVRLLAANGASVVFTGSNQAAANRIRAESGARFVKHHVDDTAGWVAVVEAIRGLHGRLDIAFANAGTHVGDSSIEDLTLEAWNRIVSVNLTGAMLTCKHAIALMKANPGGPGGAIVLNSSVNGIFAHGGDVAYSTTKGALRLLMRSVAMHCAKAGYRIRCNTIHPGLVDTPSIRGAISGAADPAAARRMLEDIAPLGRMASSDEIAAMVAYLGSDAAAFVTGAEFVIDGGSTAGLPSV